MDFILFKVRFKEVIDIIIFCLVGIFTYRTYTTSLALLDTGLEAYVLLWAALFQIIQKINGRS